MVFQGTKPTEHKDLDLILYGLSPAGTIYTLAEPNWELNGMKLLVWHYSLASGAEEDGGRRE
jgi:hypothetical protein